MSYRGTAKRLLIAGLFGGCAAMAGVRVNAATPQQVDAAIVKAKEFLYSKQKDGTWENRPAADPKGANADPDGKQWGGVTSLVTLALLSAGESAQEPRLKPSIDFLKKADVAGVYALGMRAQVWTHVPLTGDVRQIVDRDARLLLRSKMTGDTNVGLHGYYVETPDKRRIDHSVSQYGVLGLWACAENGVEVPQGYWSDVDQIWRAQQNADGGWSYDGVGAKETNPRKQASKPSLGAAGVATLFITQDFLHSNAGISCSGNIVNDSLERGMKYMSDVDVNAVDLYTLYGIERIGVASGYKYFGNTDWYDVGSERLVKSQNKDGGWGYKFGAFGAKEGAWAVDAVGTAFSLIFLSRGRAPVVASKLSYDVQTDGKPVAGRWNQRPRDLANAVHWIGRQMERPLNWQITNLKTPAVELLDAPILYIAGSQPLDFTDDELEKLKWFVRFGGLIVGNADCSSREFADSFRRLGTKLFPDYEFRNLPANHSILSQQQFVIKNTEKLSVLLLGNGAREWMVLLNANDPGKAWQFNNAGGKEEQFQFVANLVQYTYGKTNLRFKGDTYYVAPDPAAKTSKKLAIARLGFDGHWDPEPGGWERLAAVFRNTRQIELVAAPVKLGAGKLDNATYKFAHLTSAERFNLNDAARAELKKFVEGGGTLLADAAGGNLEAAHAIEVELTAMFGGSGTIIPGGEPLYTSPVEISDIKYRAAARAVLGKLDSGRVRGVTMNGRTAVYYSAEDLSVGLVGQPVDGIVGYAPKTATDLVSNMVLNAQDNAARPVVPKPPATTKQAPVRIF